MVVNCIVQSNVSKSPFIVLVLNHKLRKKWNINKNAILVNISCMSLISLIGKKLKETNLIITKSTCDLCPMFMLELIC